VGREDAGTRKRELGYGWLPSQRAFHESRARFKGFSGPIGSGKSQALCQEAIKLAYENPGRTGLIGAPTFPMLRDATVAALLETLERDRIPHEVNKAENYVRFRETRSRILFRAVEEFERLRGSNLAWFGIDELTYVPEEAWLRLEGRLRDPLAKRLCGFAVWTPKGFDWVHQRFVAKPVEGYETVFAKPFENRYLLERVPDYYARLRHSYDTRFYEQEVLGQYLSLDSGRVYYAFERSANVASLKLDPSAPLMWALDFNVDPMASVIAQTGDGVVKVLDEIVLGRARTEQACEEFSARYPAHAAGLEIYGDATGGSAKTTGPSDFDVVRRQMGRGEYGLVRYRIPAANPTVRDRVRAVNAKLKSADAAVELLVDPRCERLIRDFEQVLYKDGSQVVDKERDRTLTHLSDALGYLVWQEFGERRKVGERTRRLVE
jgi:hypothetical protein